MKKGVLISILVGVVLAISTIVYFVMSNKEIRQRELVESQQDVCKANFDKMYKVIAQTAEIPEKFAEDSKEAFKEIYPQLMEGRYDDARGGSLMSWVSEHNPDYDMAAVGALYEDLANVIEINRNEYFMEQKKLISYKMQHDNMLNTFPGNVLFSGREPVEIIIITSTHTEETYDTGLEDDISLYD